MKNSIFIVIEDGGNELDCFHKICSTKERADFLAKDIMNELGYDGNNITVVEYKLD